MIILFTDFGVDDPYVGQMKAVLQASVPHEPIIDLLHRVPDFDIRAAAYLLPVLVDVFPAGSIFVCVVDPGVGSNRPGCVVNIDGRWFVGPENGLFHMLHRRAQQTSWWKIPTPVGEISASFHGRDVFAPQAAEIVKSGVPALQHFEPDLTLSQGWPDDLAEVIYIDHYGNLITGYRFDQLESNVSISVNGRSVPITRTFSDVPQGALLAYRNANGLLEIAVNQGNAAEILGMDVGAPIQIER